MPEVEEGLMSVQRLHREGERESTWQEAVQAGCKAGVAGVTGRAAGSSVPGSEMGTECRVDVLGWCV